MKALYSGPIKKLFIITIVMSCSSEKQLDNLLLPGQQPTNPQVISTDPPDGTIGISADASVSILFSTSMDKQKTQAAFRLSSSSAQIEGSFSWEWNRLVFRPRSPFTTGGKYTLTLSSSAESESGVDLGADHVSHFFVGSDIESPRFLSSTPVSGALDVASNSTIRLTFSEPVSYSSLSDGLQISPSFSYTLSMENGGSDVVIRPANPLPTGTIRITLKQHITDTAGNSLQNDGALTFIVGSDFIAPGIISIQSGAQTFTESLPVTGIEKTNPIVIRFSEPMNRISVEEAITLSPTSSLHYQWIGDDELHVYAVPSLKPETNYDLRIATTARDQEGNSLERTLSYPFLTNHPDSIRPEFIEIRQFASTAASVPCTDDASRGAPITVLSPLSVIDTSMWIDLNPAAGASTCVLQFRFLFNNEMIRTSLVDATSASVVLHPSADLISLNIHDLQMDPADNRVMILFLGGTFPPKGVNETPIIRFTIEGGESGARDIHGNTMNNDLNIYLSY